MCELYIVCKTKNVSFEAAFRNVDLLDSAHINADNTTVFIAAGRYVLCNQFLQPLIVCTIHIHMDTHTYTPYIHSFGCVFCSYVMFGILCSGISLVLVVPCVVIFLFLVY